MCRRSSILRYSLILVVLGLLTVPLFARNHRAQDGACVKGCTKDPDYQKFKNEAIDGSVSATYCMAAALYNCTIKNCSLTAEKKTEYRKLRDQNIDQAKELGRD